MHLRQIQFLHDRFPEETRYPFCTPVVQGTASIELTKPVTLLVGENGAGKSTVLESLAAAAGCVTIGAANIADDPFMQPAQDLGKCLRLVWTARTTKGFFLRAEDFINFTRRLSAMERDLRHELNEIGARFQKQSDYARSLASLPYNRSLSEIRKTYGDGLDTRSHGERFFHLFQSRLVAGGLYLLDEPETPLSPLKQLALIALIKEMVEANCQFIIATHSPILLAFPDAVILNFDELPIRAVAYDSLEHVRIMKDFLNHPEAYLRHL